MEKSKEYTATSGITVTVRPLPGGAYRRLQMRALEEHPDVEPPTREIDTAFGEKETIDDTDDPTYRAEQARVERDREEMVGEAVTDWCVDLDTEAHAETIARLEKRLGAYPEDADERRIQFLSDWVFRTEEDWREVVFLAISQAVVNDEEVAERLKFFRRQMAGDPGAEPDAPGPAGDDGVDVS